MPASLDLAAPKLGSGARFKKLSTTLAARGAKDPDALAAFIGRKKFGSAGMGKLSAGKSLANDGDLGIYLADAAQDSGALKCPQCGYSGPAARFSAPGDGDQDAHAAPAKPVATAMANGTREALELATATARRPIHGPTDILVKRENGVAVLRHRHGGAEIASLRKTAEGKWVATIGGKDLQPRDRQQTALREVVGTWNGAITAAAKRQDAPLQPVPQQTELMAEYGIPAQRSAAFATPTAGASDGPRVTTASADPGGSGGNGLGPKGQLLYKKLKAKGFPDARAMALAKNADKFTAKPAAAA